MNQWPNDPRRGAPPQYQPEYARSWPPQPGYGQQPGPYRGGPQSLFGGLGVATERTLLSRVIGWLAVSIGLTAAGAYLFSSGVLAIGTLPALIVVFGAVIGVQWAAARQQHGLAVALFSLLSLVEGVFLGPLLTYYAHVDPGVVVSALLGTVGVFILCAAAVWSTSYNFAAWGKVLIIALMVGILAMLGGLLLGFNTTLVSAAMGIVFVGLALVDFSRVRARQGYGGRSDALVLALALYLDFLNLFLILLRLLGRRD